MFFYLDRRFYLFVELLAFCDCNSDCGLNENQNTMQGIGSKGIGSKGGGVITLFRGFLIR